MDGMRGFRVDSPNVVYERFENEVVIIHFESGNYYSLENIGADIWRAIASGSTLNEIVNGLRHRYIDPPKDVESIVNQFVEELQQEQLIVPVDNDAMNRSQGQGNPFDTPPKTERPNFESPILQRYTDMRDMLLLDPIHEVDEAGWPAAKPDSQHGDK